MSEATSWDHALAVLVGLVLPAFGALQARLGTRAGESFTTRERIATYWANSALLVLLAAATMGVWHLAGRAPETLGLRSPRRLAPGLALAAAFLVLWALDARRQLAPSRIERTRERMRRDTPFLPTDGRELAHSLVLVASAAVCEELVFRGFLVAYVAQLAGGSPPGLAAAVLVPSVVFGLCHLYQGAHAAAKVVLLSAFFGAILVVTGSLWIPIALHFAVDLLGVALGPRILARVEG